MGNLGTVIFNAVKKGFPLAHNGKTTMPGNLKFSLKNPYILEALPENKIDEFIKFDGQDLKTVCNLLDNPKIRKGFDNGELQALYKKAFPYGKPSPCVNEEGFVYMHQMPGDIGEQFDAHGIAKFTIYDQLKFLNNLLTKGIDKNRRFYSAPLVVPAEKAASLGPATGTAGGHAYYDGSFIIVADKGKSLVDDGIKHVIVNDAYYNIISDLRRKFPDVNFVRADEAVEYFSRL